jgi:hypothetical protein
VFGVENKFSNKPTSDTDQITNIAGLGSGYWGGADFGFGDIANTTLANIILI